MNTVNDRVYFVRRKGPFADGTPAGVDIYAFSRALGRHSLQGCLAYETAKSIWGRQDVIHALPADVRITDS